MTAAWLTVVTIADHTWSIEQNLEDGADADVVTALDDLRFGWALPAGLYPAQPAAMTAEFALNIPSFPDYGALGKGDPVTIEIHVPAAGPVVAGFYGRATDLTAQPRNELVDDTVTTGGVTLDVVAVDYTVDVREAPNYRFSGAGGFDEAHIVVDEAFQAACGGLLSGSLGTIPPQWVIPIPPSETYQIPDEATSPAAMIDTLLLESVSTDSGERMIIAPLLDPDGALVSGRQFTLDVVTQPPDRDVVDHLLDADAVDGEIAWTSIKGDAPTQVVVVEDYAHVMGAADVPGAPTPYVVSTITSANSETVNDHAQALAEFYVPTDLVDLAWQVKSFTWLLELLTADELDTFPVELFPQWKLDEGDAGRSACYGRRIWVTNIDPTVTPYPDGPVSGLLVGTTVRIREGFLEFELALRAVRHHDTIPA